MKGTTFAVIGVGKYGATIARRLAEKGAEVYAIDNKASKIEAIKDDVALAVTLDSTDKRALESQNLQNVDAAIIAIGENFQAVILTSMILLEMGVPRVIARSGSPDQKLILQKIGITEVLTPEDEVASFVAERLVNPSIVNFLQLPDNYEIAEIKAPRAVVNKTIAEIDLRLKYNLSLITIKREQIGKNGEIEEHITGVTRRDTCVLETDTLVVFGLEIDVARFIEIND
jgi:trk system potassium uptake protein TrkA